MGESLNLTQSVPKNGAPASPLSGDVEYLDLIERFVFVHETSLISSSG